MMFNSMIKQVLVSRNWLMAWLFPVILLPIVILAPGQIGACSYIVLLMAFYWLTEALPLAVTALLPIVLMPLSGILSTDEIVKSYVNETLMVFLGSIMATVAIENSKLHQRLALRILMLFGASPKWLCLGFMTTTAFLSMWISNTACTALMVPIVDSVLKQLENKDSEQNHYDNKMNGDKVFVLEMTNCEPDSKDNSNNIHKQTNKPGNLNQLSRCIFLSVAFAAAIGGTGTLTGTSTNMILKGFANKLPGTKLTYANWMFFSIPCMIVCLLAAWLFMVLVYLRNFKNNYQTNKKVNHFIQKKYETLGSMTFHEAASLTLFTFLFLLWFFRDPEFMTGWSKAIHPNNRQFLNDASAAFFIVILCFLVPANPRQLSKSEPLITWKLVHQKVPWGIFLLMGGGFAMADGANSSGLSTAIGQFLMKHLNGLSPIVLTTVMCCFAHGISEVSSNAAACTILLPVVIQLSQALHVNAFKLMLPVTLSCSHALMLPAGAASNAIVFEAGGFKLYQMAIPGLVVKIFCLIIVIITTYIWGPIVFDLNFVPVDSN